MKITDRGKRWEIRNSLWIIWSFTMLFNCIAFFWIGIRVKQRKWILFGCLYFVLCFIMPIVVIEVFEDNEIVTNIFFNTFLIVWVTSIGHAFISRYEYLVRREALIVNQAAAIAAYRQKVQAEYLQQGNLQQPIYQPPEQFYANSAQQQQPLPQQADSGNLSPLVCPPPSSQPKSQQMPGQQTSQPGHKIDLNTATEQQLSSLPGVSIALAKKALGLRTQSGGFFSTKDFCERLELMPHFAVQIEKLAFVGKAHVKTPQNENNSRVIDI